MNFSHLPSAGEKYAVSARYVARCVIEETSLDPNWDLSSLAAVTSLLMWNVYRACINIDVFPTSCLDAAGQIDPWSIPDGPAFRVYREAMILMWRQLVDAAPIRSR